MFFVDARYDSNPAKVPQQLRYMSHLEEGLQARAASRVPRHWRSLQGVSRNERLVQRTLQRTRRASYFRFTFTVDPRTAGRFARLDGSLTERVIRDAVD